MMYTIEYSKDAEKTLRKWKKSNPRLFKKATKILLDIMEHSRTGLGHPEPLVGGHNVTYSRHITADDEWHLLRSQNASANILEKEDVTFLRSHGWASVKKESRKGVNLIQEKTVFLWNKNKSHFIL